MFDEEKFNLDIENIRTDFAMENMEITDEDVSLLRKYANDEIDMCQLVDIIKDITIERNK